MTARIAIVLVLVLAAGVANARPGEVPERARDLADRGRAYHDAGDYGSAIVAFTAAYAIAPSPALLFNLAQAYRLRGNCDDAMLMYKRFLATGPTTDARAIAEEQLVNVERCAHKIALAIPLDEKERAAVPAAPGPPEDLPSLVRENTGATVPQKVGVGLAIGGGLALSLATYLAVDSLVASNEVEAAYAAGAPWREIEAIDARGDRNARLATVFGIGGGVAIVAGVTTYLLGKRTERRPAVVVSPKSAGGEVSITWPF